MNGMTCTEAREAVQTAHDDAGDIDAAARDHIFRCRTCRDFYEFLSPLGEKVRTALSAGDPRADEIKFRSLVNDAYRSRRHRRLVAGVSGLAAVLVLSAGTWLGGWLIHEQNVRDFVSEETRYFVDDLFDQPVFEDIEYLTSGE